MFTRNFCRVLLLALLSPATALALGLGEIHLQSALNAPLDADIDLVGASADDMAGLKAGLGRTPCISRNRAAFQIFVINPRLLSTTLAPSFTSRPWPAAATE